MTQKGKCDVCRRRKVKCDEARPCCGNCRKSNRTCRYTPATGTTARPVKFIHTTSLEQAPRSENGTQRAILGLEPMKRSDPEPPLPTCTGLALRRATTANSGGGVFCRFTPIMADDETQLLLRDSQLPQGSTSLIQAWKSICSTISPGYREPHIIGEWLDIVPQRIGHSKTIDVALKCLIASTTGFMNRNEQIVTKTHTLNGKALVSIRNLLLQGDTSRVQDEVLLAISFLSLAELLMAGHTKGYNVHSRGRNELMVNMSKQGLRCSETCRKTFFAGAYTEIMPSIMSGKDSIFDTPVWLALQCPRIEKAEYPCAEEIEEYIARVYVRIPRLIRLVRASREAPNNDKAFADASALAADLYRNTLDEWIERVMTMSLVRVVPTDQDSGIPHIPNSFHFASVRVFKKLLHYWHTRCVVSSCMLVTRRIRPISLSSQRWDLETADIAKHEYDAAKCIAMSAQWAANTRCPLPLYEVRLNLPLISACGVWSRTERCHTAIAAEAQRMVDLKAWAAKFMAATAQKLNIRAFGVVELRALNEILIGGRLVS